jgi:hypothetical protein
MSYSLYDASIGVAKDALASLANILEKIEASPVAGTIAQARLHPDMLPFTFQVHCVTAITQKLVARSTGAEPKDLKTPETLEDMKARVAEIQAEVDAVSKDVVNGREKEIVPLGMGRGKPDAKVETWQYIHGYYLPNVFFHLVTAYDIARKEGVELGKQDYQKPFLFKFVENQI